MIQTLPKTSSKSYGVKQQKEFVLRANSKAFEMLISNLYENKVRAVLSELGQNAYDSHIAANNKKPFDIRLPETFDSRFEIRDYGTGMPHDFVMNEYLQAFYSSKDQSNDFSGAFGIGRLSALSICNNYTLISFVDGKKCVYSISTDEGIPKISFVSEHDTEEPNGVKISFAVPDKDRGAFYSESLKVFKFYPIQPNIDNLGLKLPIPEYNMKHEENGKVSWGILTDQSKPQLAMGLYLYDIDVNNLDFTGEIEKIASMPFFLSCDIGEVDVVSNRQSLSYTDKTKAVIKQRLELILKTFEVEIHGHFKEFDSNYEACREFYHISGNKYKQICNKLNLDGKIEVGGRVVRNFFKFDREEKGFNLTLISRKKSHYGTYLKFKNNRIENFDPISFVDSIVLINDLTTKNIKSTKTCEIIRSENTSIKDVFIITFDSEEDKERIVKEYGLEEVGMYSEYFNRVSTSPNMSRRSKFSKCLVSRNGRFEEISMDLNNDEFIYIPVKNKISCVTSSRRIQKNSESGGYEILERLSKPVIYIRNCNENKLKKNSKAIHIKGYAESLKKNLVNMNRYAIRKQIRYGLSNLNVKLLEKGFLEKFKKSIDSSDLKMTNDEKIISESNYNVLGFFGINFDNVNFYRARNKIESCLYKRWPILHYVKENIIDDKFFTLLKQ